MIPTSANVTFSASTTTAVPAASTGDNPARTSTADKAAAALLLAMKGLPTGHPDRATARERAITAWLPLARHLARRFQGRGESLDDLTQIATMALIKAIDRFDPGYGADFAPYAVPTVLGEIKRHFRDHTWDVRVPRRLQELRLDINTATTALMQTLRRSPTLADLAQHLGRSEGEILEGLEGARAYSAVSLQTRVGNDDDGAELGDLVGIEDSELALVEIRASMGSALQTLPARERQILVLRFFGNLTQTEIAERVGLSQMHVSRLLAKSLTALRRRLSQD